VAILNNPSPEPWDEFGYSVAIHGNTVVAGAYSDDTNARERGSVYVFGSRPRLGVVSDILDFVTISWMPATSSGFVLQYADKVTSTNWINAPSGAMNPVPVSTTNAARFYRLIQP